MQFKPINERMAYLWMKGKTFHCSLINVYAPTEYTSEVKNNQMYQNLKQETELLPKEGTMLILEDFNA